MAQKKITDLQLRSGCDDTCNFPVDDAVQTWRVTTNQIAAHVLSYISAATGWLTNAMVSASAAIARSKLASGTASHVVINDGSGVMSSEASLAISRGGTGQATANAALNALLPSQSGKAGKVLRSDGTDVSFVDNPSFEARIDTSGLSINGLIVWPNENFDTDNAYNTGTGQFTVPAGKGGKYLSVLSEISVASNDYFFVFVNGNKVKTNLYINTTAAIGFGSCILDLAAGDVVDIRSSGSNTLGYSAGNYQAKWAMIKMD